MNNFLHLATFSQGTCNAMIKSPSAFSTFAGSCALRANRVLVPSASVGTAATVKRVDFRIERVPYRTSWSNLSIQSHLMLSETSQLTHCYAASPTKSGNLAAFGGWSLEKVGQILCHLEIRLTPTSQLSKKPQQSCRHILRSAG